MDQAREKPKILLLRQSGVEGTGPDSAWGRLRKALQTFTLLEEREVSEPVLTDVASHADGFDHVLLDSAITHWPSLVREPVSRLTIVFADDFPWQDPAVRPQLLPGLARFSALVLQGIPTGDLLRVLHLYLLPKRLAGVTPLLEKGSLVVGEKIFDLHNVGGLTDRFAAYGAQFEKFSLGPRLADLRQLLPALLTEAMHCARQARMAYPFVDFQLGVSGEKLGVNLRFPRGGLAFETISLDILSGRNLFWHQIWQLSDATVITYHRAFEEIEVMLLLDRPERNLEGSFRTLLTKSSERSSARENLLDPPENFQFKLLSEIQARESADLQVFTTENLAESVEDIDLASIPPAVADRIEKLNELRLSLNERLERKDQQLQESIRRTHHLERELGTKRGELLRATKTQEAQNDLLRKQVLALESQVELHRRNAEAASRGETGSLAETISRLELSLRSAEGDKAQLRESLAHEQKKYTVLEQKYSAIFKENTKHERELNELKSTVVKLRKEQANKAQAQAETKAPGSMASELKGANEREVSYKQEIKKLAYKVESQEKNLRGLQNDLAEKTKLLDQKLKAAKLKEVDLLKRIEELTTSLKKASKAA